MNHLPNAYPDADSDLVEDLTAAATRLFPDAAGADDLRTYSPDLLAERIDYAEAALCMAEETGDVFWRIFADAVASPLLRALAAFEGAYSTFESFFGQGRLAEAADCAVGVSLKERIKRIRGMVPATALEFAWQRRVAARVEIHARLRRQFRRAFPAAAFAAPDRRVAAHYHRLSGELDRIPDSVLAAGWERLGPTA